ncbi:MAG: molybdenum ABC transporter ATP-binding protein [Phenylobacterium sp.]
MSGRIEAELRGRLGDFEIDARLDAPAAGVTVLFGPSGCGKTTLLRAIAGLERLAGRLVVDGQVWQDGARFTPPHQRPVGYVFQDASLLPHLSVRRNLLFGYRRTGAEKRIGLDQVVALLGLEPLLDRGVGKLSGGERQRIGIGRALLSQPRLLLMDEPLASLDAARKAEVLPYLDRLHREMSTPILYVTHDRGEAQRLGDRLIPMQAGRLLAPVDLRAEAEGGLAGRLAMLGPGGLLQALRAEGLPEEAARLTIAALQAGTPAWRG